MMHTVQIVLIVLGFLFLIIASVLLINIKLLLMKNNDKLVENLESNIVRKFIMISTFTILGSTAFLIVWLLK